MGRARPAGRRGRRARRWPGSTGPAGPCWRRRRSGSGRPGPAAARSRPSRPRPRRRRPRRTRWRRSSSRAPRSWPGRWPRTSLARGRADRLLDDDADPARDERRDPHERMAAEAGQPRARVDRRGLDEVRRDLDARDEVAARDDLAVEDREDLERVDPVDALELGDPDVDDAGRRGDEVDPALVRAARRSGPGPPTAAASRTAASSSWSSPASATRTRDRLARFGGGERDQVVAR